MSRNPGVQGFYHAPSGSWSYVVHDPDTRRAAVVDPVLDYEPAGARTGTDTADGLIAFVRDRDLVVDWILETHAHADRISAAPHVRAAVGGTLAIGAGIREVQRAFRDIYHLGDGFPVDGSQFDHLFEDGETFRIGGIEARVIATPGHTNDSISYLIGDALFVGDTMFMPDVGTARCDFPGGDAARLYRSIERLLELPGDTRMFVCHDYPPAGRELRAETSVAEQRAENVHVGGGKGLDDFVRMRTARDATLPLPTLLLPSVQVNIRAGGFPAPEANGVSYLKIPVNKV